MTKLIKYSEMFGDTTTESGTFQGEGNYTGKMSVWLRFFLCNLNCDGFGQSDPTDPSTYVLPYQEFDVSSIKRIEDLPVFEYGCDSSYSWSAKFKHLQYEDTAKDIADKLLNFLPNREWTHEVTGNDYHMCFTGGEPLLPRSQSAIVDIMKEWEALNNYPKFVTIETNGTQKLTKAFIEYFEHYQTVLGGELFFSVSPKLHTVSGELTSKAIKPETVAEYYQLSDKGQLKFVVRNNEDSITELDDTFKKFKEVTGTTYDPYVMPVGATKEQQESDDTAELVSKVISKGYHISGRLHCSIFGNKVGT